MRFFKKRKKDKTDTGRGTTETRSFAKKIEVLNFVPIDYRLNVYFYEYLKNPEKHFEDSLKRVSTDDLCVGMFEPEIDSVCNIQRASSKEQLNDHLNTILHDKGILSGAKKRIEADLAFLYDDQLRIKQECSRLEAIQNNNNNEENSYHGKC